MPSILVVVEPAYLASETVRAAAALARRLGFSLLAAVLPPGRRAPKPEVLQGLADLVASLQGEGLEVRQKRLEGDAEKCLLACVREADARLVVFADDPQSSRIEGLTGAVIRTLPTPLILVREPKCLTEWALGNHVLKVMVAMDFNPASEAAFGWLRGLRAHGPCDVVAAHVSWLPGQRKRLGMTGPADPAAEESEIRRVTLRDMQEFVGETEGIRYLVRLSLGRTADALAFMAADENTDLVVVGTHQRSGVSRLWHGSVAGGVLSEARTNVACVPANAQTLPAPALRPLPKIESVLVATDFSEAGNRAILYAWSLLPKGGTVHLVHVTEQGDEAEIGRRLRELQPNVDGVQCFVEVVRSKHTTDAICGLAERRGADVLCVGTDRGAVARTILRTTSRPVLVVKPSDRMEEE